MLGCRTRNDTGMKLHTYSPGRQETESTGRECVASMIGNQMTPIFVMSVYSLLFSLMYVEVRDNE